MASKTCTRCLVEKEHDQFPSNKRRMDGLSSWCRQCANEATKAWESKHKERKRASRQRWRARFRDKVKTDNHLWYEANKERVERRTREWRNNHAEQDRANRASWRDRNRPHLNEAQRERRRKRYRSDELFRLKCLVRARFKGALKVGGRDATMSVSKLIGCSYKELMDWLGPQPTPDAAIDHICPLAQALSAEEHDKLWHYWNLRWLPATENKKKGDQITEEGDELCRILLGRGWIV